MVPVPRGIVLRSQKAGRSAGKGLLNTPSRNQNPQDYLPLLSSASTDGEMPLLIGGQAVNLWALLLMEMEPAIRQFEPFTSVDCDVIASGDWLLQVAQKHGLPHRMFRAGQSSPEVGWIRMPAGDAEIELQVLRDALGLMPGEAKATAFQVDFEGQAILVLSPVALLKAKIANLHDLDQKDRYDLQHVQILLHCVRAAIKQHLSLLAKGELTPRKCIETMEAVVKVISSKKACAVSKKFTVDLKTAFPLAELSVSDKPSLRNFVEKRLKGLNF